MEADDLRGLLRATRRRQWAQGIMRYAAAGLALGSAAGLLIVPLHLLWPMGGSVVAWVALATGSGLLGGAVIGLTRRPTLWQTATAVDRAARLKDRAESALQFSSVRPMDAYRQLQVRDAVRALHETPVATLFPWRWPRAGNWAIGLLLIATIATFSVPAPEPAAAMLAGPPRAVQIEAGQLAEELAQLNELAKELDSEEVKDLARQLRNMLASFTSDTRSSDEAILELARMTAAIESAAAPFDSLLLDQTMREVGEGMAALDGFRPAAEMLQQGQYEQAADQLDRFGQRIGSGAQAVPSTGGLLQARLGQLAEQAKVAGLPELSGALSALHQAIRAGSQGDCKSACKRLGSVIRKYGRRVAVGRALQAQLAGLAQAKQRLSKRGYYCHGCRTGGL